MPEQQSVRQAGFFAFLQTWQGLLINTCTFPYYTYVLPEMKKSLLIVNPIQRYLCFVPFDNCEAHCLNTACYILPLDTGYWNGFQIPLNIGQFPFIHLLPEPWGFVIHWARLGTCLCSLGQTTISYLNKLFDMTRKHQL